LDNRLVKALPALKQPAQLAVMRILNQRRSGNAFGEISKLLDSRDTSVRQMAYASLAGVSGKDHLPALFDLLNKGTNQNEIAAVQNAIIAVLPELTAEKRQSAI